MPLRFVIDGFNVSNHRLFSALKKNDKDPRQALPELISCRCLCGSRKNRATVVFDGYPPAGWQVFLPKNIEIIFSRSASADSKIKNILERKNTSPAETVIVSDDREVRFFARSSGAKVLSVEDFLGRASEEKEGGAAGKKAAEGRTTLTFSQMEEINRELRKKWLE
jgi:hypothetical protein